MFTAQQYRAKAAEYDGFLAAAQSPAEIAEYRGLKQSYALHADNLDWLAANAGKTMSSEPADPPRRRRRDLMRHTPSRRTSCAVSGPP